MATAEGASLPSAIEAGAHNFPGSHKLARTLGRIPLLRKGVMGSDSPDFVRLDWTTVDADPGEIAWMEIPADPEAGLRPRGWNFSVIGINRNAFRTLGGHDMEGHEWAEDAIICLQDGEIKAGTNPDESGRLFGGKRLGEEVTFITAAIRHGRDAFTGTMGHFRDGEIYVPEVRPAVIEYSIPVTELERGFPGTVPAG